MIGDMQDRKDRPAIVRFERIAVEDVAASKREGRYIARDVDFALITPPYSKDIFKTKVTQWLLNMKQDVQNERMPAEWEDMYKKHYKLWLEGQEIPLNGSPIKGWGVISPAQQETLIRLSVLTVEDLAAVNDEGIRRIGMGGMELKNKASAWLAQLDDKGPLTQEIAGLKSENSILKSNVETLTRQVQELMVHVKQNVPRETIQETPAEIGASDLLDETEDIAKQYEAKFGKPPHHRMLPETIAAALKG